MSNRTGVIYARQSFGQEQDDEGNEAPSRVAGVATTCGGVFARDNLATGSQDPPL